jgi:hypothetical protein
VGPVHAEISLREDRFQARRFGLAKFGSFILIGLWTNNGQPQLN